MLVVLALGLGRSRLTPLKTRDWLLLGLGLSQAGIWVGLLVTGWLFALGLRARLDREAPPVAVQSHADRPVPVQSSGALGPGSRPPTRVAGTAGDADRQQRLDRDQAQLVSGPKRPRAAAGMGDLGAHPGLPGPDAGLGPVARPSPPELAALGLARPVRPVLWRDANKLVLPRRANTTGRQ